MRDVPSSAIFCSSLILMLPGICLVYFSKPFFISTALPSQLGSLWPSSPTFAQSRFQGLLIIIIIIIIVIIIIINTIIIVVIIIIIYWFVVVRSQWVRVCNSRTKPISRQFCRLIYFQYTFSFVKERQFPSSDAVMSISFLWLFMALSRESHSMQIRSKNKSVYENFATGI